jgi:hypothetical protein
MRRLYYAAISKALMTQTVDLPIVYNELIVYSK